MGVGLELSGAQTGALGAAVGPALLLVAVVVVPRRRGPSSAWAWLLLFPVLPVVGAVLFALIGSPRLPRSRRAMQGSMDDRIAERARDVEPVGADHPSPPWLPSVARLNQAVGAMLLLEDDVAGRH